MNKLSILLVFLMLVLQWPVQSFSQTANNIDSTRIVKVLTFNIFHGETPYQDKALPYKSNLDAVAEIIRKIKPDIVALQEVDNKTSRSKGLDLVTELAIRTKMNPLFGSTMKFDGGEYGLGILSNYSFISTKTYPLHSPPDIEPRAALEVYIIVKNGDTLRFVSTHLDYSDKTTQIKQAQDINNFFGADDKLSIIAGDFNAKPGSESIRLLKEKWVDSSKNNEPTSPSISLKSKIDYIMFRPAHRWRVIESRVIKGTLASDHNPVLTVFELLPE